MSGYKLLPLFLSTLAAAVPVPESASPLAPVHAHVLPPLSPLSNFGSRAILTPDYWAPSPHFSNMSEYNVTSFAAGATNLAIMRGSPAGAVDGSTANMQEAFSTFTTNWNESVNSLQILYPKGSNAPRNDPQGGTEFYAHPLDLMTARNVTLQYSVYFPSDFDFVKGGKLPGMYGGHKGCSGGNSAVDTRMMWRKDGEGELYLYVPKDKQTPALCSTPPKSICSSEWGLSIGRGAWKFARGDWTTIRQDIWLNTPGQNDGGFNIWINGQLVINANEVRYRENAASCNIEPLPAGQEAPFAAVAMSTTSAAWSGETAPPSTSTGYSASSESAIATSMTFDDGSYTWSAPPVPAASSAEAQAAWKRETDSMVRGDSFLLPTPSSTSVTWENTPASSTSVASSTTFDSSASPTLSPSWSSPASSPSAMSVDPGSAELAGTTSQTSSDCSIGFIGLFFSTFFGGHTADWSPSNDQYTYFKEFSMWINAGA